ncbi:PAS domain-containing sensor histidine kinase [Inediibacterium massiliense]|uniref:PAS domain-containing sensor histidine kinase n=1 Tax=Inediibacterium massiliense TaxID=1658111 RepID=UPI0006B49253|nr:PAS domain-containing sensor histidine kinase [Inediibacterium massiliense]
MKGTEVANLKGMEKCKFHNTFIRNYIGPFLTLILLGCIQVIYYSDIKSPDFVGIFSILVCYSAWAGEKRSGYMSVLITVVYIIQSIYIRVFIFRHSNIYLLFRSINSILLIGGALQIGWITKRLNISNQRLFTQQIQIQKAEELSYVMVARSHMSGKVIKVPPKFIKMIGYADEEFMSMNIEDFTHPDDFKKQIKKMKDLWNKKYTSFDIEKRYIKKNKEIVWVYINMSLVCDEDGNPLYFLNYVKDISKRKEAEEALEKSEKRLRQITNSMCDMISQVNAQGMIEYVSPSCMSISGYKEEELIGKSIFDFVHPKDLDRVLSISQKAIEEHIETRVECRYLHADGHYIWIEEVGRPCYDGNEKNIYSTICSRDVTYRKRAQENEKLLREAKEYDELRNEFFANISHELRTPLNVILGVIQLLEFYNDSLKDEKSEKKVNKYIKVMKQNCNRLLRLVNNLIDITKIDAGFLELHLKNVEVINILEEITLSVADYVENKGIALEFDTAVEEKVMACDPDKLERILLNLLSNAVKFTDQGGKISVNIEDHVKSLCIKVKDTGIGIPEEECNKIFERFRQVDQSLTRNREGSGIGLSLVKSLVEMHHGTIQLKSKWQKGSEFIINIPITLVKEKDSCDHEYVDWECKERIHIEFSDIYA